MQNQQYIQVAHILVSMGQMFLAVFSFALQTLCEHVVSALTLFIL